MDLDFIITCTVYLSMILFVHMSLKNNEAGIPRPNLVTNKSKEDAPSENEKEDTESKTTKDSSDNIPSDSELIINENELKNISSEIQSNDFMKYLDVEGADSDSTYQQLVSPLQENTIDITENDTKSDLDKYFTNIKEEQYNFDPVPTKKETSNELYSDVKSLNVDNKAKDIMAFDEFVPSYANI